MRSGVLVALLAAGAFGLSFALRDGDPEEPPLGSPAVEPVRTQTVEAGLERAGSLARLKPPASPPAPDPEPSEPPFADEPVAAPPQPPAPSEPSPPPSPPPEPPAPAQPRPFFDER